MLPVSYRLYGTETWVPFELTAEPTFSQADPGGWYECSIPARVSPFLRARLDRAAIRIEGLIHPAYFVVDDVGATVHGWGWQHWLDDPMRGAVYRETEYSAWLDRTRITQDSNIDRNMDVTGLHWTYRAGEAYSGTSYAGFFYTFPERVTRLHLRWAFARPNVTYAFTCQTGVRRSTPSLGEMFDWTTRTVTVDGTTATVDVAGVNIDAVQVSNGPDAPRTPPAEEVVTASDLRIEACTNAAGDGLVTVQAAALLLDSCDRLDPLVLPAGDDFRAFIGADATDLGRCVFPFTSKENEKHASVYTTRAGKRYGWWSRVVHGDEVPVAIYETRETAPSYYAVVDGVSVTETLAPAPFSGKALITRAKYQALDGTETYTDVTDADVTHKPVALGIPRYDTIDATTTDAALAAATAATHQSDVNRDSAPGQVLIAGPISENGRQVYPCDLEAGRLITLDRTKIGTVTGKIVRIDHEGRSKARLTLERAPDLRKAVRQAARA